MEMLYKLDKIMKKNHPLPLRGFTLIELLIAIAILCILAAGILIAINPAEKIAKAKDSTKKTTVSQLTRALESYSIANGNQYPPANNAWITSLINNGELKNLPQPIPSSCAIQQNGYCYKLSVDGTEAVIYTSLESSERPSGASGTTPYFLWSSATGESGTYYSISEDIAQTSGFVFNQPPNLTQGLVAWLKMNGNANDSSGNNNNATINGATLAIDKNGRSDRAYSFDGVNDYMGAANSVSLALSDAVSISGWVNAASLSAHASNQFRIADKFIFPTNGWYLYYNAANHNFNFATYDGSSHMAGYPILPSLDTWYHVVGVSDGVNSRVYVNGVSGSLIGSGVLTNSTNPLKIGGFGTSDYSWIGLIDDIRVYNRALSSGEVLDLFNAGPQ
jgi:prepilin-type N-terminal cleavage/methylation domain-containing protein